MIQKELYPSRYASAEKRIPIGNGYALEWMTDHLIAIYRHGGLYKTTEIKAGIDKRRLVIELVIECGVTKSKLAKALKVSRQSIDNWENTYKRSGFEGLINSYKGSRRKGRKENGDTLPCGNKARQLEAERKKEREERQKRQLAIDFGGRRTQPEKEVQVFNEVYDYHENRYAGVFLYWGILQYYYTFMGLCESYLGPYATIVYLFAAMLIHNIPSFEQLKSVYKRELGRVIGITQVWSKPKIGKLIHTVCSLKQVPSMIEEFFTDSVRKSLVALCWLYIDGHFIPYYGSERLHKGYYTQRDKMMPGQTELFVHDCHGQIVYFSLQEGKGDLKDMMRAMSERYTPFLGNTPPLIIVDRESWGVEHFLSLNGYRFVTWEKFTDGKALQAIPDTLFGPVFHLHNRAYQAYEENKTYRSGEKSITLRRIIIWNKTTNRRVACVAQDDKEETITLATAMLGRWGCSENSFKHMKGRWHMHYNPLLEIRGDSVNQEVPNPEYTRLKKMLSDLKKACARHEQKLGKLPFTYNKDGSLRKSKRREKLQKKYDDLTTQRTLTEEKLKDLKETIRLDEIGAEKLFKELDTEGKNLWDLTQSLVWNVQKKLIALFKEYLPDNRDLFPVLDAMAKGRGWVRSTSETIEVRFEPLDTPRFKAAQIQLCRALNEKQIRLSNGKLLLYDVAEAPDKMSKKLATK
jgi:Homeodomain-like domain